MEPTLDIKQMVERIEDVLDNLELDDSDEETPSDMSFQQVIMGCQKTIITPLSQRLQVEDVTSPEEDERSNSQQDPIVIEEDNETPDFPLTQILSQKSPHVDITKRIKTNPQISYSLT